MTGYLGSNIKDKTDLYIPRINYYLSVNISVCFSYKHIVAF